MRNLFEVPFRKAFLSGRRGRATGRIRPAVLFPIALALTVSGQAVAQPDSVPGEEPEAPPAPAKPSTPDLTAAEPKDDDANAPGATLEAPPATASHASKDAESIAALADELAALRLEVEELRAASEPVEAEFEPTVRLYGFMETGLRRYFTPDDNRLVAAWEPATTFVLGGVNLYADANPAQDLRVLTELRFGLWPDYAKTPDSLNGESTEFYDSQGNLNTWSGVVLERAHADWTRYDFMNVRVGYFLTPYGIWNVDHGAPTLISARVPRFMSAEVWPSRQLGVELFGIYVSGAWEVKYHAWVGNGRTQGYDATDDKMVGGRLLLAREGLHSRIAVGGSGFYGKNSIADRNITNVSPFTTSFEIVEEYREYGVAADLTFDWEELHVRAEYVMAREMYEDDKRATIAPGVFRPDRTRAGAYGLVSYDLPWLGLQPFGYFERAMEGAYARSNNYSGGVNIRLSAPARLKAQFSKVVFEDPDDDLGFSAVDVLYSVAF